MTDRKERKQKRRATHTIFLDDKAFQKYTKLKELIKVTQRGRVNTSAIVDALITTVAEKNLIDDFLEMYEKKLAERAGTKQKEKINLEEFIEALRE